MTVGTGGSLPDTHASTAGAKGLLGLLCRACVYTWLSNASKSRRISAQRRRIQFPRAWCPAGRVPARTCQRRQMAGHQANLQVAQQETRVRARLTRRRALQSLRGRRPSRTRPALHTTSNPTMIKGMLERRRRRMGRRMGNPLSLQSGRVPWESHQQRMRKLRCLHPPHLQHVSLLLVTTRRAAKIPQGPSCQALRSFLRRANESRCCLPVLAIPFVRT